MNGVSESYTMIPLYNAVNVHDDDLLVLSRKVKSNIHDAVGRCFSKT